MSGILDNIKSPADVKKLTRGEIDVLCGELRALITETALRQGGHLASNLGTVELIVALHRVFNCPEDKLLFDVGHQAYAHKILTGRREGFSQLRSVGGVSGFPSRKESDADAFSMGHSSTALSAALGLARARDIKGEKNHVVAVVGDGAMTGGMAYEALNDIGENRERLIIILNDNKMSIAKNVGALSKHLAKLRLSKKYWRIKNDIRRGAAALPVVGDRLVGFLNRFKFGLKSLFTGNRLFEALGVRYYGPVDGHDIELLTDLFHRVKTSTEPVLIHVLTEKGRGNKNAERHPERYHGVSPAENGNRIEEKETHAYAKIVGDMLCAFSDEGQEIVAVTAAMGAGTGLDIYAEAYPSRCFDVGIAEPHAVTMSAGLAAGGVKPFFAVYSSFLQRAYDQILHDVCLDALPVTLLVEHAGAVSGDGPTHQGLYDIALLRSMPNMTLMQPKDGAEFEAMLRYALGFGAPLAIRYPKGYADALPSITPFESSLSWELLRETAGGIYILAAGNRMLSVALGISGASVVNARVLKPIDEAMLAEIIKKAKVLVTLEEGVTAGGFGEAVLKAVSAIKPDLPVVIKGFPDEVPKGYTVAELFDFAGLTRTAIERDIKAALGK